MPSTPSFIRKMLFPLQDLPQELVYQVVEQMRMKEVCALSQTSKYFHTLCGANSLWQCLVDQRWRIRNSQQRNYRKYYIEKISLEKTDSLIWGESPSLSEMNRISKRHCHTANNTTNPNQIIIIGGQDANIRFQEVFLLDTKSLTFREIHHRGGPWKPIARHTSVSDGKNIYIVGGYDGIDTFHELSIFNIETSTFYVPKTFGTKPDGRSNAASALVGRKLYFHGGSAPVKDSKPDDSEERYKTFGDFYSLDIDTLMWTCLDTIVTGDIPTPRSGHKMVSFGKQIFLFGGGVWDSVWFEKFSDTYIFDTEKLSWSKPETFGMLPNTSTFTIPFRLGNQLFIFAGAEAKKERNYVHNKTFILDMVTLTWSEAVIKGVAPSARDMGSANVCGDKVVFFGGYSGRAVDFYDELYVKFKYSDEE